MDHADAYLWAGFKTTRRGAVNSVSRLLAAVGAREYLDGLLEKRRQIEADATAKAVEKLAIKKEHIISEMAKLAFVDIRKVVNWHGHLVEEEDNPDGGDVAVVKRTYSNNVVLVSSDKVDDDTAGAISEVSQPATGGLKVKTYDKRAALMDLAKLCGFLMTPGESPEHPLHITRIERVVVDPAIEA